MKIKHAEFVRSVYALKDLPKSGMPEIAFSGRSNVGKSSLINKLLGRKGIAKTSSTPGRTQSINFIEVNSSVFFVDLPGYGYARVPASVKKGWQHLLESYLKDRPTLRLVIIIVDARREPSEDEAGFADWLSMHGIDFVVVLTKTDKVKRNARQKSLNSWRKFLNIDSILSFSAVTGEGSIKIWREIDKCLQRGF